ncbi:MAG: hypothetical protein NT062_18195 [Proteobacteria bacterium]|jgi:hypothetical protein|nr:hypothetical protein [Pseudomonadota bacterium]
MKFLAKIVVTGFGLALGGALFKKAAPYLGLDDKKQPADADEAIRRGDGATDPGLQNARN